VRRHRAARERELADVLVDRAERQGSACLARRAPSAGARL